MPFCSDAAMWAQGGARYELARAHDKREEHAARRGRRSPSARRRPWDPPPLASWAEAPEEAAMATEAPDGVAVPDGLGLPPGLAPDGAAVAAGGGGGAAVAASRADLDALRATQPFKLNNTALKWIRDTSEDPPGFPTTWCVDLTNQDPMDIGILLRNTGMAYSFRGDGERQPWSWRQMLAGLKQDAKDQVLGTDPEVGVTRITCQAVDASYDHKRWHAARHVGTPFAEGAAVPVWDFHVYRTDNVVVRFHTSLTSGKVEVATVGSGLVLPGPPMAGKGKSDGRGTYRHHTAGNYEGSLRGGRAAGKGSAVADVGQHGPPPQADAWRPPSRAAAGEEAQEAQWARPKEEPAWPKEEPAWPKAPWWEAKEEPASPAGGGWRVVGGAWCWSKPAAEEEPAWSRGGAWRDRGHGNGQGGASASSGGAAWGWPREEPDGTAEGGDSEKWKAWGWWTYK